jgi:heme/copper-type cytochrome/quinol oxidase subunit 3
MTDTAWDDNGFALPAEPGTSTSFWGMAMFILTEATLFTLLLLSYFYLRFNASRVWPPDGIEPPKLALPIVMTVILLSSSIPMFLATSAMHRGRVASTRMWLAISFLLGLAFVVLQGVEYADKLQHFTPRTDVYGSIFFTITGFHGAHVIGGLLLNLWASLRARKTIVDGRSATIEAAALYWHFVDVVWIAIFVSLYIGVAR